MAAAIDKLQQLDDDELDALIELAQARANSAMSKRNFLKAAGVLGTGAVLGGGAASELTGDAQAAASTVDGDGDIGTPANPEDVFADALAVFDGANNQIGSFDETGIETPSVDTDRGTIDGDKEIAGTPSTTSSISPTFGSWRQSSENRGAIIESFIAVETDGSTIASIDLEVDEDGGTTADYNLRLLEAPLSLGSGGRVNETVTFFIPNGGQWRLVNQNDPNNSNAIAETREGIL